MRTLFTFLAIALLPTLSFAKPGTSFYICAHPDDCILFMNPNLYDDIHGGTKTVTIYLTSGDAGLPFTPEDVTSYPVTRERASLDALGWIADAEKPSVHANEQSDEVSIAGHSISRVAYANTVTYFLRLPDGGMTGDGFPLTHKQSLRKLKNGAIKRAEPIDGEAAYEGWGDLVGVIADILMREAKGEKRVAIHISEPDVKTNSNDHSDHTTGASAVLEALGQVNDEERCYQIYKHIDYAIAQLSENLSGMPLANKAGSFAVLTGTERRTLDHHDWNEGHVSYLPRNYFTVTTLPEGCK